MTIRQKFAKVRTKLGLRQLPPRTDSEEFRDKIIKLKTGNKAARALDQIKAASIAGSYSPAQAEQLAERVRLYHGMLSDDQKYERQVTGVDGELIEELEMACLLYQRLSDPQAVERNPLQYLRAFQANSPNFEFYTADQLKTIAGNIPVAYSRLSQEDIYALDDEFGAALGATMEYVERLLSNRSQ